MSLTQIFKGRQRAGPRHEFIDALQSYSFHERRSNAQAGRLDVQIRPLLPSFFLIEAVEASGMAFQLSVEKRHGERLASFVASQQRPFVLFSLSCGEIARAWSAPRKLDQ